MSWIIRTTQEVIAADVKVSSLHKGERICIRGEWYKVKRIQHWVYTVETTSSVAYVKGVMPP